MKKLFLAIVAIITVSVLSIAHAQSSNYTNTMSQGQSPFRPTQYEMSNGIEYLGEGVYRFDLTEDGRFPIIRDFGKVLAEFRTNHPGLEQESMTMADAIVRNRLFPTAYLVTFREKK